MCTKCNNINLTPPTVWDSYHDEPYLPVASSAFSLCL